LAVIGGLVLGQPVAMMAYIILRPKAFYLSLPLSLVGAVLCWLMFYSMTNYGFEMGVANLRNELLPFLLSALPSAVALAVYGWAAARMGLVMPERSLKSLFVWRSTEATDSGKEDAMTNQDHVISELRLLNRKLATSARLMEYHMEYATYGIVITGADGRILRTNKTAEKMLLEANPLGHHLHALVGKALGCDTTLAEIVAGGEGKRWGGRGSNGENRWYEFIVTPLKESDTRAITTGYYVLIKDITTAVYAEARSLALRRIRDLNQAGQVLGHDFSNLLIGAEAQLKKIKARAQDQDSLEAIRTLSSVLNNARDMLKQLGSGSQFGSPSLRTENIADLVDEAVSICRGTAEENAITVLVEGQRALLVEADRSQMVRVFTNLLKNAIRASHPGGVVTITIERRGSGVQTVIADEGSGMSSEEIDMAFDPGFSTKGEGKGGLGLAISYLMVEAHGGSLDLKKNPAGKGLCAVVWLAESRGLEDYSDLSGQNVIVASTEPETIQKLVAELEENRGCYVAEAHNEEEVIALLEETKNWDAMIVDESLKLESVLQAGRPVPTVRRIASHP
jgi:signal transduction histidine kinase